MNRGGSDVLRPPGKEGKADLPLNSLRSIGL